MILTDGSELEKSNIIDIRGEPLEITEPKEKSDKCSFCYHGIEVDEHERLVTCKKCGSVVDPFDYLLRWAKDGSRKMERLKYLEQECHNKAREIDEMKAVLAREKANVRKINPNAPEVITWKRKIQNLKNLGLKQP